MITLVHKIQKCICWLIELYNYLIYLQISSFYLNKDIEINKQINTEKK